MPLSAGASLKTFRGEIDLGQTYESNPDRVSADERYDSRSSITPRMIFTRLTQGSSLTLMYAPSLNYSYQTKEESVNHRGSGKYVVYLARRLRLDLRNAYVKSDDLYTYEEVRELGDGEFELSERRGRREYYTNRFSGSINLEYARASFLNAGYTNHVFRNRADGFTNFARHNPFASISHRFNHQWGSKLDYSLTVTDYDEDDDDDDKRNTHQGIATFDYKPSPLTRLFVRGGYQRMDYDRSLRKYEIYSTTAGIYRKFSPMRSVEFESGYSKIIREDFADNEAFNMLIAINTTMKKGSWRLYGESGTEELYYRGIDKDELSIHWRIGMGIHHVLTKNISGNADVYYSEAESIERDEPERQKWLRAKAELFYSFARYYRFSIGYSYSDVEVLDSVDAAGKGINDSYENHHVFVKLTAGKDIMKW